MANIEFPSVSLRAPTKAFKKNKETGDVTVLARISFDAPGVDDETAMALAMYADTGIPIKVVIQLP